VCLYILFKCICLFLSYSPLDDKCVCLFFFKSGYGSHNTSASTALTVVAKTTTSTSTDSQHLRQSGKHKTHAQTKTAIQFLFPFFFVSLASSATIHLFFRSVTMTGNTLFLFFFYVSVPILDCCWANPIGHTPRTVPSEFL
jgi:hypothetical protein